LNSMASRRAASAVIAESPLTAVGAGGYGEGGYDAVADDIASWPWRKCSTRVALEDAVVRGLRSIYRRGIRLGAGRLERDEEKIARARARGAGKYQEREQMASVGMLYWEPKRTCFKPPID